MKNLHVILCIDSNFILGAGTLIISLLKNNSDCFFHYYIYTLKEEQVFIKEQISKRLGNSSLKNFTLTFIDFNHIKGFSELQQNVNKRVLMCVGRLIAINDCPVPQDVDRLFYFDTDMLCVNYGISGLTEIHLEEKILAANPIIHKQDPLKVFNCKRKHYFCAGFLVINLKEWKNKKIGEKSTRFVIEKKPKFSDQDALNVVCEDHIVLLPNKFNETWTIVNDTVIVHYVGIKPWCPWIWNNVSCYSAINVFRQYAKLFEPDVTKWITFKKDKFALVNFNSFSARFATKWISKQFLKKGNLKVALYFYLQHLLIKVRTKGIIGILLLRSNTKS